MGIDPAAIQAVEGAPPWFPDEAKPLLAPLKKVVPVLGAGTSRHAHLDDAKTLAGWLLAEPIAVGIDIPDESREDLFDIADAIVGHDRGLARELRRLVADHLQLTDGSYVLTPTLRSVVHAPSKLILTFNYDEVIEAAAAIEGLEYESRTQWEIDDLDPYIDGVVPAKLTILHLHGSVRSPDSIVLDARGYGQHLNNQMIKSRFAALALTKNFLFLGMSMKETYLLAWLQEFILPLRHVCVCDADTYAKADIHPTRHGTIPAVYPAGAFSEVDVVVSSIFGDPV